MKADPCAHDVFPQLSGNQSSTCSPLALDAHAEQLAGMPFDDAAPVLPVRDRLTFGQHDPITRLQPARAAAPPA
jgi:hypothetical protein